MQVRLDRPDIQRFIDEQIKAGRFSTPEAVVEDAMERAMEAKVVLTEADRKAIQIGDEQFAQGRTIDFNEYAARVRRKYGLA